jgi:hypothetical protein
MLSYAGNPKIITDATDSDYQSVIIKVASRDNLFPFFVISGGYRDFPVSAIQSIHAPTAIAEMVASGLRQVFDFILMSIERARSNFMEQRFPI